MLKNKEAPRKFNLTESEKESGVPDERSWSREEISGLRDGQRVVLVSGKSAAELGLKYAASGLAHDLNNVLAPVITSMEVLRLQYSQDEKALQLLDLIERHVRQGPFLVQQILSLAQGLENAHTYVQLGGLLNGLRKQLRETFPKNIQLDFHLAADLRPVLGSLADLHEAILNLCLNASEAMPEGGKLGVTCENVMLDDDYPFIPPGTSNARFVLITVSDTGAGIPEDLQEMIFEAGYTTKPDRPGLGLYRANQITLNHHGQLLVNSIPHEGTLFKLYLPAAPGTMPELTNNEAASIHGHGEGILVVDDEEAIREVTQQTFETFGYRAIPAANGADAVSAYMQSGHDISLVFTDMNMPVMDGSTTIQALRSINPNLKIIATSGLNAAAQMTNAANAGANHFLAKPYTAVKLLLLVQSILQDSLPKTDK